VSIPKSGANRSYAFDYLRNTSTGHDKFYRVGAFQIESEWYLVTNWGKGSAINDSEWYGGQMKAEWFPDRAKAMDAAVAKTREKKERGYVYARPNGLGVHVLDGGLPQRVYDEVMASRATKTNSATGKPKVFPHQKPQPSAKVSIHTKDGALKPALARRVKWRASE
jgi:predicted DNA-binding WGR domain protein